MQRMTLLFVLLAACGGGTIQGDDDDDVAPEPDAAAPDAIPADAVVPTVPRELDGQIVINEIMAANAATTFDETAVAADWIELYNPTDTDIDLHGYGITDDLADPNKFVFGPATVVPAGGHLVLWADGHPEIGGRHLGIALEKDGGALGLARPDGSWIDRVQFGAQETDFSASREPDGSSSWVIDWHPTPSGPNAAGSGSAMGLEDPAQPPEQVPAAGDVSARLYPDDSVLQLQLLVSSQSYAALVANPREYQPAMMVVEGRLYGPVGVRCKGMNSFEPFNAKPSLRISVDEYVTGAKVFGLKDLTLNNMHSDYSMIHERIAYWVARQAGVPASRASYAFLTVNGQPYGLYTNLETVKKHLLERWFDDAEGPLYEATDVDFRPQYVADYGLESGDEDRSLIQGATDALAGSSPSAAITAAGQYVDMDEFRKFWAMESIVAQFDAMPYSMPGDDYYVYADPGSQRLAFLPWGMDESYYSADIDPSNVYGILASTCKAVPSCFQAYVDEVWDLQAQLESQGLLAEVDRIRAMIAPYVTQDTRKWYSDSEVATYQGGVRYVVQTRRTRLGGYLPPHS